MKMKNRFIVFNFLFGLTFLSGQENPNVELPQFVITGKEAYEFPQLEKQKPELISIVSEKFFKPIYSPDNLEVKELSEPTMKSGEFLDSINFINGEAEFKIGNNILPSLSFTYKLPSERSMFSANVNALNQRAFLPYADRNKFGAKLFYSYIISDSSNFLPFSKIETSAFAENESFKLFASPLPDFNRQIFNGYISTSLQNVTSEKFNYDIHLEDDYLSMKNDSVKENILKVDGFAKYSAKVLDISLMAKYQALQTTFAPLSQQTSGFIQAKALVGLKVGSTVKTMFGFEFAGLDSNKSFFAYAGAALQLSNGLSLFAEYHPTSSMLTQQDFIKANRYYSPSAAQINIFSSTTSRYTFNVKYEYERTFEVASGFTVAAVSSYPYYNFTSAGVNNFMIDTVKAKLTTIMASFHLYPGKYGFFSGEFFFQNVKDTAENSIPNISPLHVSAVYGLFISPEISLSAEMMYYSSPFLNFANTEKGKDYFNISLKGEMLISNNMFAQLELSNILNKKNEYWKNYQELPLTVAAGIKINW